MSWTNRVVWQEGMFLRTQHFQQQDRWMEQLVRGRVQALRPHPWGLVEYALDRDLLSTGLVLTLAFGIPALLHRPELQLSSRRPA